MEYLVLLYVTYNDGKATKKAIYTYATETEAIGNYHTQVGGAMKDETVKHIMAKALNTDGGIYEECTWNRPVNAENETA
jgi:hypothetical protein